MDDLAGEVEAGATIRTLAELQAVVRFQADGVVRVAVVHPSDPDERIVVTVGREAMLPFEALDVATKRLVEEVTAAQRRHTIRLVAASKQ